MSRVLWLRFASLAVLPLLVGCSGRDTVPDTSSVVQATAITTKETPGVDDALLAANDQPTSDAPQPKEKPLGVVISFPVVDGEDKDAQHFAAGIGWYLTDAVAGAPELGQSPLRSTVYQVARERKIMSLRMPQAEAIRVARVCGATHVAVGTYTEGANEVRLTYQIHPVGNATALPVVTSKPYIAANREALLRQLPQIAQELRTALGVTKSAITAPPLTGVSPEILLKLGSYADTGTYTPEQESFLRQTGKTIPLIAECAILLRSIRATPKDAVPYARLLLKNMPVNTQTLGILGYAVPGAITSEAKTISTLSDQYKDNYLLAHSAAWVARTKSDWNSDALYSPRGAQNAPANPDARLAAGWSVGQQADRLRQGRQYTDIDGAMMVKIQPLYTKWLTETKAATQCDPLYGKAYQRLASAALFVGDRTEADEAMTMARKIYTDSPYETYAGALEMYQPKWGGDPARLLEVATEAADAHYNTNDEALEIYRKLGQLQFTAQQAKMGDRLIQETEKILAQNPKDMYAHYLHGSILHDRGTRRKDALADFEANAQNYPKHPRILFDLGRHYVDRSQFDKAEVSLRKSIALQPRDAEALYYLGWALKQQNKLPEAQKYTEAAVAVTPDYASALSLLGTVNGLQKRTLVAIRYYEKSLGIRPFQPEASVNLASCYNSVGREEDTIRLGEQFLRYYPGDTNMPRLIGQAKDQLKRKKAPTP